MTDQLHFLRKRRFLVTILLICFIGAVQGSKNASTQKIVGHLHPKEIICNTKSDENRVCPHFDPELLWFFLSLFLIIAWGAFVRTFLRMTKISLPYTVVLMITGIILGTGTHFPSADVCDFWSRYTKIARMSPKVILYTFLPALIFESAYSMDVHIFMRSLSQILVLALPGMVMAVFATGACCFGFMTNYGWSLPISFMFGAIVSATDPVAVVAILKELGTSETLSMLIEGESLLNDGVAILMFEIFRKIVDEEPDIVWKVVIILVKISFGGPLLGFSIGRLCSMSLARIFNDAATEITITLFVSYFVYWIGEALGVSGVISVVVLGLKLKAESTSFSPEVEKMVHHFWSMVGYLANTVLFVMVGIILSETAVNSLNADDWFNLLYLYLLLNLIRLLMLALLMPWMTRIGYGTSWRDIIVSMWGGLRGAVGLCLALEVYYAEELCELLKDSIGPKFLFHTAGIVFLTLCINGTTTSTLLDGLGMTVVSAGRRQDMANAVKQVIETRGRATNIYKDGQVLAEADWKTVAKYTKISDPYIKKVPKRKRKTLLALDPENDHQTSRNELASDSEKSIFDGTSDVNLPVVSLRDSARLEQSASGKVPPNSPLEQRSREANLIIPSEDLREQAEEARQRLLKALKVSFWRQYEQGILSSLAVKILTTQADKVGDKELHMIHAKDFSKYYNLHGTFFWIRRNFIERFGLNGPVQHCPRPLQEWRYPFWVIATKEWFSAFITVIVLLNLIPAIWEFTLEIGTEEAHKDLAMGFLVANYVFIGIYLIEFIIKIIGEGYKAYFRDQWNWIDVLLLVVGIIDIGFTLAYLNGKIDAGTNSASSAFAIFARSFRLTKVIRSLRLIKCFMPRFDKFLDTRINYCLFMGYDIGKGFVTAVEDVMKFLPQMVGNESILRRLETALRTERLETIRLLGLLQQNHPFIAIAVKTRHASRAILNQMRETLTELKKDGLLDVNESNVLLEWIEKKMKGLWSTPPTVQANSPDEILSSIVWLQDSEKLLSFIKNHGTILNFSEGDTICGVGDPPNGIYVIINGMVKAHFLPTLSIIEAQRNHGELPNVEVIGDTTFNYEEIDYLQVGHVIGEIGVLTGLPVANELTCETHVTVFHVNQQSMKALLETPSDPDDSLESRIWRSIGMKLASRILLTASEYQPWTLDRLREHVEHSTVPIGHQFDYMILPEFVNDVVLLQGQVEDIRTHIVYVAPIRLPPSCKRFEKYSESVLQTRYLVIAEEENELGMGVSQIFSESIIPSAFPSTSGFSSVSTTAEDTLSLSLSRQRKSRQMSLNDKKRRTLSK